MPVTMIFRAKLQDPQHRLWTYTFVPPPQGATSHELDAIADTLQRLLASAPIDAIHVPEVRPDPRSPRPAFVPKLAPRAFTRAMAQRLTDPPEWLLDRGIVDHHWTHQEHWLRRTIHDQRLSSLMLIGGASREIRYPGIPVADAAQRIRAIHGEHVCLGGIAIPTRQRELERLMAKTEAGLDLFVTQILGEADSTCRLLADYHRTCAERGVQPRPMVLSLAPVGHRSDIAFLEAWGVRFHRRWRRRLESSPLGVGWRSVDMAVDLLDRIRASAEREAPSVPLGVNVEHVRPRNLELSAELLQTVASEFI